jgi:hypothetical protein
VRSVPRLCEFYPGICLKTEEKARKNLSQVKKNLKTSKKLDNSLVTLTLWYIQFLYISVFLCNVWMARILAETRRQAIYDYKEICYVWLTTLIYLCDWYWLIYLLTEIGLTPGGGSTVHIYIKTIHRTTQLTTLVGRLSGIRAQSGRTKINDE